MNILESVQQSGSKVQVLWIALPLAAALLLPGCPLYLDNGHALACHIDADCPSGQSCIGGACQVITSTCTNDRMCGAGQHCDGGACVPGTRTCVTHGDCDVGFMCDGSSCETSTLCTSDADCPVGGQWCDYRGTCVPHGTGDCRTANDCTTGSLCIEGSCTALPTTCQFDHDCPAGTTCVNAECTAVCTTDNDCVAGDTCNTSHHCEATPDCETSATCASGEHCVGGRCLPSCTTSATCATAGRETSYCGTGATDHFCHPSWQPQTVCNIDSDCATGRLCLSHVCRTPCPSMTDSECSTIDSQLPHCMLDAASTHYLCVADGSTVPECRISTDCTSPAECVNASCQ